MGTIAYIQTDPQTYPETFFREHIQLLPVVVLLGFSKKESAFAKGDVGRWGEKNGISQQTQSMTKGKDKAMTRFPTSRHLTCVCRKTLLLLNITTPSVPLHTIMYFLMMYF